MPRLCFGGSFNPIHHGHLICARAVAEAKGYDHVELIPAAQSPHKPNDPARVPPEVRLEMCLLATKHTQLFAVNDIELRRAGPSYTIDTVRELTRLGWGRIHWLIGADMLLYLPKWRQPVELLAEVEFVVMARPGWTLDWNRLPPEYRRLQKNIVEAPQIEISSSQIRARVARGLGIDYLTPEPVCGYIRDRGLYR
jgi:nicotinate-nucleotide adenylyltransferase